MAQVARKWTICRLKVHGKSFKYWLRLSLDISGDLELDYKLNGRYSYIKKVKLSQSVSYIEQEILLKKELYGFWNVSKYWFNKLYKCQETTKLKKKKKLINSRNSTKYYKPIYLPIYQQKIILSTMTGVRTWINSINKYNPCNEWGSNLRSQNCMLVDSVLDHLTTESLA